MLVVSVEVMTGECSVANLVLKASWWIYFPNRKNGRSVLITTSQSGTAVARFQERCPSLSRTQKKCNGKVIATRRLARVGTQCAASQHILMVVAMGSQLRICDRLPKIWRQLAVDIGSLVTSWELDAEVLRRSHCHLRPQMMNSSWAWEEL